MSADPPERSEWSFERVYAELRRLAARCMADERGEHTLQPTALVHEAWIELSGGEGAASVTDRNAFLAVAAQAMRRTLIDHARGKGRLKRGGGWKRVVLGGEGPVADEPLDLVRVDLALDALRERSEDLARLVELRFFAGLPMPEVAAVLGISERTARREWSFARSWLQRWLEEESDG